MFQIENKVVSIDILETKFCCDIKKCNGACCYEGQGGAIVEKEEVAQIKKLFPKLKKHLNKRALEVIEQKGFHTVNIYDGDWETPLLNDDEDCVYSIVENGIYSCVFQKLYYAGEIDFIKPISCHLYPIRISKVRENEFLNIHNWDICKDAYIKGNREGVMAYECVKDALIKKYGDNFYNTLVEVSKEWIKFKDSNKEKK